MFSVLLDDPYCVAPLKSNLLSIALVVSVAVTVVLNYYGYCKRDLLSRRYVYQILPIKLCHIEVPLLGNFHCWRTLTHHRSDFPIPYGITPRQPNEGSEFPISAKVQRTQETLVITPFPLSQTFLRETRQCSLPSSR